MKKLFLLSAIAMVGFAFNTNAQTVKQTEITSIDNSLNTVLKLTPINFSYDKDWAGKLKLSTQKQSGFAVEEVAKVAPELVVNQQKTYSAGKNSTKTATVPMVDYETLIPLLVGSIKEQQLQIEALKKEISQLRSVKSK
ncbi:tail fiber domain-containing protein [Pedobacter nanyangensis]|uniref:tail fiber domain-containing protein n=1 Tax=Pedobacter nanyangensis TaxID=1562389 RepID=UPI0013B38AE3|nr:tail fiber domain-containing protein [Pedobacter nanyangensis]